MFFIVYLFLDLASFKVIPSKDIHDRNLSLRKRKISKRSPSIILNLY